MTKKQYTLDERIAFYKNRIEQTKYDFAKCKSDYEEYFIVQRGWKSHQRLLQLLREKLG